MKAEAAFVICLTNNLKPFGLLLLWPWKGRLALQNVGRSANDCHMQVAIFTKYLIPLVRGISINFKSDHNAITD
jgi:hypothetical protein